MWDGQQSIDRQTMRQCDRLRDRRSHLNWRLNKRVKGEMPRTPFSLQKQRSSRRNLFAGFTPTFMLFSRRHRRRMRSFHTPSSSSSSSSFYSSSDGQLKWHNFNAISDKREETARAIQKQKVSDGRTCEVGFHFTFERTTRRRVGLERMGLLLGLGSWVLELGLS